MPTLCEQGAHLVQMLADAQGQLTTGRYVCVYCGIGFREYHELVLQAGVQTQIGPPPALPSPMR